MEPTGHGRLTNSPKNVSQQNSNVEELWDQLSQEEDSLYSASPPCTPRQMKRMSGKHLRGTQNRAIGRSPVKEKVLSSPSSQREQESAKPYEYTEEFSYKQGKKQRSNIRSIERDKKKTFEGSFMLGPLSQTGPYNTVNMDPMKPYLSLGPVTMSHSLPRTHRQTSRTDCPADRLKFFETLRLLLKLTSMSSKKKEKEQRGQENTAFMGQNNEVIWLELQAWHARRSITDQDLFLYTARQAIPDIINKVLHFKVDYSSLATPETQLVSEVHKNCCSEGANHGTCLGSWLEVDATALLGSGSTCKRQHLQRQRLAFEQVKGVMGLLESVEALYPSLQTLQKDYEKYAARDFQGRMQALCLWLNITQDLNQKLRVMGTVLGLGDLSNIGWPVFEIPSPRCSHENDVEEEHNEESDTTTNFTDNTEECDGDELGVKRDPMTCISSKFSHQLSEELFSVCSSEIQCCSTGIYRPFVDKALKQMGLRKLILRLHKLMDRSLQRSRTALLSDMPAQELSEVPDCSLLYSDYLPELSRHLAGYLEEESASGRVSCLELQNMNLPSFRPAFLVLCRVLLNVIHECLKLRLEQRPAGKPSLLSIKQLVRECKEVLKGGLLMKQYYQFMLRGIISDSQGLQTKANIDEFEEDLHEMLEVYFGYMRSWIEMLQQLPQASHSLKNLLEEEWNFTKVITPYIRGGEAQSGKLFCDIAGMLLRSTGDFLDIGLQKSCDEFWESADGSTALDEIRRSVIETSRSLKELFHEARERASKALGFAKMLRKVENMLLIVMQSGHLVAQRKAFQQSMGELLTLRREQTSSQPLIAKELEQLKNEALNLCSKINRAIDRVEYMFTSEFEAEVEESESVTLQQYYREAMIQGYNFAFEYHKEVVRLMSGEFRQRIGERYIAFARKWMNYVLTKCESGRGTRPRWATQGFDFLQAIEPVFISALPEDDFLSLQALMNECIGHVIGKPHSPVSGLYLAPRNNPRPVKVPRCHSDPPNPSLFIPNTEGASVHENDRLSSVAAELHFRSLSRHSSPTEDRDEPSYPKADPNAATRRSWELRNFICPSKDTTTCQNTMDMVFRAICSFEEKRYAALRQRNVIGQVCSTPKSYDNIMHVGLRKVTFKWQRGNKIGEGQYGKVYACINVDTGELMAMKEIRFQPNDHKTIKETADELKIFEGIKHPNLVRYFGVELHREEMYIFMEYCDEGTLEEVSRLGLQEHVIRLYCKQITTAINVLHEHGIVHRDIKGANIFLTSSGLIKLGDFGCSVKLKNNAHTMPGEVNSTLGTAAYMAPEVITRAKGEGHGRAADIWSLGCVLIEMVTGKRPWHEYEHNFQIMYKVGMGHKPPIPEKLSTEGKDFLAHCLESEPKCRPTASVLLDHPFVKV
ncbi:mitogen-activated protein kinase kinase kinase 4 isoform X1 [Tachysurus ichikawai]